METLWFILGYIPCSYKYCYGQVTVILTVKLSDDFNITVSAKISYGKFPPIPIPIKTIDLPYIINHVLGAQSYYYNFTDFYQPLFRRITSHQTDLNCHYSANQCHINNITSHHTDLNCPYSANQCHINTSHHTDLNCHYSANQCQINNIAHLPY